MNTYVKTIAYAGGKSDRDIDLAIEYFRKSGAMVFRDRFAGSGRVGLSVAASCPDARVELVEVDECLNSLYLHCLTAPESERLELRKRVEDLNKQIYGISDSKAPLWGELCTHAGLQDRSPDTLAAFIAVMQNSGSANPRRRRDGFRNAGFDRRKARSANGRSIDLPDLRWMSDRVTVGDSGAKAFVYADVPYYRPDGGTTCYLSHRPSSFGDQVYYLRQSIAGAAHLLYCNYNHRSIANMLRDRLGVEAIPRGRLSQAAVQGKGSAEALEHAVWFWSC